MIRYNKLKNPHKCNSLEIIAFTPNQLITIRKAMKCRQTSQIIWNTEKATVNWNSVILNYSLFTKMQTSPKEGNLYSPE